MEINLNKSRLIFASWIQPHMGGKSAVCSKCQGQDYIVRAGKRNLRCTGCGGKLFAVHVDKVGEDSGAVHEVVCIKCLTQVKSDIMGAINGVKVTALQCGTCNTVTPVEPGGLIDRRGEFKNEPNKRILIDG